MSAAKTAYDAIVIGVGAMGSAALYHLARRGVRVLGLEQFNIPHELGSSHGITRIIRLSYYEHPSYVPLLRRAYELWRDLEHLSGRSLLHITGSVDASSPGGRIFEGSLRACHEHNLKHEVLTSATLSDRFPAYRLPKDAMAILQPEGGFLLPELCISAHVELAHELGAEIHARERVIHWETSNRGVRVETSRATYEASQLLVSAGAWAAKLVPELSGCLSPERQVLAWFQPRNARLFRLNAFPVFNIEVDEGHYYGSPVFGVPGFKFGRYHHLAEGADPDNLEREANQRDEQLLRSFTEHYFPEGAGPTMALRACLFTNTPDGHFILDRHPRWPQVWIASPCSGHGFKMASVIGEVMADLIESGSTHHDISLHRLSRFL